MSRYFDPQGNPISVEEWSHLFESRMYGSDDWWRVGETEVGDRRVSTVWLGLDHNYWGDGPPLIFESMAFGEGWDDEKNAALLNVGAGGGRSCGNGRGTRSGG